MTTPASSAIDLFESNRPVLFGVAYRMLGSAADAEDLVQETWLKWRTASVEALRSPRSWLVTVITRLCLDQLRSARARREQYVGPWLPEPITVAMAPEPGPEVAADAVETIDLAFLVMLERLGPVERAAFVLHDVFAFSHDEVAEVVGKSTAACRQVLHRARARLQESRKRFDASAAERERLTRAFLRAAGAGDMEALVAILAEDVALYSDGGGKALAALKPIYGRHRIANFAVTTARKYADIARFEPALLNGGPGLLMYEGGELTGAYVLGCSEGRVHEVWIMRNPDKLAGLARQRQVA